MHHEKVSGWELLQAMMCSQLLSLGQAELTLRLCKTGCSNSDFKINTGWLKKEEADKHSAVGSQLRPCRVPRNCREAWTAWLAVRNVFGKFGPEKRFQIQVLILQLPAFTSVVQLHWLVELPNLSDWVQITPLLFERSFFTVLYYFISYQV